MNSLLRLLSFVMLAGIPSVTVGQRAIGLFEGSADVGEPTRAGSVGYDPVGSRYRITGGGRNMWFTNDAFHFVWKKMSGDASLSADIAFEGKGVDPHRKACLLVRQSLEPDSAYADAALHGDGLTSLQYREAAGVMTREIQSNVTSPTRLRVEKRGNYVSMSVSRRGEPLGPAGGSFRLELKDPFFVGLGVCAHNDAELETAVFSKLELTKETQSSAMPTLVSTLETIQLSSKDRRVVWWTTNLIEAPNWAPDGTNLYFNSRGRIHRVPVTGGMPQMIETDFATRCNNDHGISPDGRRLAISDQSQKDRRSRIYILPITGGSPTLITESAPSYWHGWSADGKTLAFCGERNGEFDVYAISVDGGAEKRLTTAQGLDDGPDYSQDGKFIYFNSARTGKMQIWRMKVDGTEQERVTNDNYNNWFPHPSPDGRWLVFLSYEPDVKGHPENKDVMLRVMPIGGGRIEVAAKLLGGQGTINVPSWSPDSRRFAFVSYQTVTQ